MRLTFASAEANPKDGDVFYGCTNYHNPDVKCKRMIPLPNDPI